MKCHYRNVKVTIRFKSLVCLPSLVSLSFTSVMFSSSSKPLFPHFIDPSTLTVCTRDVRNVEWLVHRILSFSQSVHATYETMTKLEWLVNRILSFSQSVHATYETITDFSQCGAHSGSPQL